MKLTPGERIRGWVFFPVYLVVLPTAMGLVQRAFGGTLPVAEANVIYYLLCVLLVFLLFWGYLKDDFHLLLDELPANLFAFFTGLAGAGVLHILVMRLPYPVDNPNTQQYWEQFALAPAATAVILMVLMPIVEEVLFRGLLFGGLLRYSKVLGYVLSAAAYALYCVWQFVYAFGTVDFRYLLLAAQYLPMSLALAWSYDKGGCIWTPIALHAAINGATLFATVYATMPL